MSASPTTEVQIAENYTLKNVEKAAQPSVELPDPLFSTCHAAYDIAQLTVSNQQNTDMRT